MSYDPSSSPRPRKRVLIPPGQVGHSKGVNYAEVARRVNAGEYQADLARELKVSQAAISQGLARLGWYMRPGLKRKPRKSADPIAVPDAHINSHNGGRYETHSS